MPKNFELKWIKCQKLTNLHSNQKVANSFQSKVPSMARCRTDSITSFANISSPILSVFWPMASMMYPRMQARSHSCCHSAKDSLRFEDLPPRLLATSCSRSTRLTKRHCLFGVIFKIFSAHKWLAFALGSLEVELSIQRPSRSNWFVKAAGEQVKAEGATIKQIVGRVRSSLWGSNGLVCGLSKS